ncbi:alcohol dehydrogenase catalytic domain-containing protein [Micrococcaceae bacterium Sec5.7]
MPPVTELPASTPAVVAHAAGDLRIEDVPLAAPATDEAVVEVAYGGICGSDLHYWIHGAVGESVLKAPMVLGHEIVGVVTRSAADGSGPAAGTAVAVHPATPAPGAAKHPEDRPNLSPGCTYLGSAARFPHTDGAFSRFVNLPSRMLRPLPGNLDLRTAALIEPASVAWHAVGRAGGVAGKTALAITRELELLGSFRFNDEIDDVIRALADGTLHIAPVITHEFTLDRGLEAFEVARNSAESGKVLLDFRSVDG